MIAFGKNVLIYAEITVKNQVTVINSDSFKLRLNDWGDGMIDSLSQHTYNPGNYIYVLTGDFFNDEEVSFFYKSTLPNDDVIINYLYINPLNKFKYTYSPPIGTATEEVHAILIYPIVIGGDVTLKDDNWVRYMNIKNKMYFDETYEKFYRYKFEDSGYSSVSPMMPESNYGLFNDINSLHGIAPKLNGKLLSGDFNNGAGQTHTYTTHPNKIIKTILANSIPISGQYTETNRLTFDKETFTISVNNESSVTNITNFSGSMSIKIIYEDDTFDTDYFTYKFTIKTPCLIEDTLIDTINGKKPIQDITYDDLLLCWDMFRGKFVYQHPYFIKNENNTCSYLKITLEDNSCIGIVGEHTFYDMKNKKFLEINENNYKSLNFDDIILMKIKDKSYSEIKIKSIEEIKDIKKYYTLFTSGIQTYVANDLLNGNVYLNYIGKINDNHTLDLTRYKYVQAIGTRSLDEFKNKYGIISSSIYYGSLLDIITEGLLLGMERGYEDIINEKYKNIEESMHDLIFWQDAKKIEENNIEYVCITTISKSGIDSRYYKVGDEVELADIKRGWYCVADNKVYHNKYIAKTNTVLEENINE